MTFDELRRKLSSICGELIPPFGVAQVVHDADARGRFTNRQIIDTLIAIYEYLEANQPRPEEGKKVPDTIPVAAVQQEPVTVVENTDTAPADTTPSMQVTPTDTPVDSVEANSI